MHGSRNANDPYDWSLVETRGTPIDLADTVRLCSSILVQPPSRADHAETPDITRS